jgi:Uncharacterized oxidoreductase dhs-27
MFWRGSGTGSIGMTIRRAIDFKRLPRNSAIANYFAPPTPLCVTAGGCANRFGQMYSLPGGEGRFLDWQCVQVANWASDVSYFIVSGLSVNDRRSCARDLLTCYLGKLREFGVNRPPSRDAAHEEFRAHAFHGLSWAMCMVEMQAEEVCTAITERFSAAVVDLGSLDILGTESRA